MAGNVPGEGDVNVPLYRRKLIEGVTETLELNWKCLEGRRAQPAELVNTVQ